MVLKFKWRDKLCAMLGHVLVIEVFPDGAGGMAVIASWQNAKQLRSFKQWMNGMH